MALAFELATGRCWRTRLPSGRPIRPDQGVAAADREMERLQHALWSFEDLKIGLESLQKNGPGHAKFVGH